MMQSAYTAADGCWKIIMCLIVMLAIVGVAMGAGMNSNIPDLADRMEHRPQVELRPLQQVAQPTPVSERRQQSQFPFPFGKQFEDEGGGGGGGGFR